MLGRGPTAGGMLTSIPATAAWIRTCATMIPPKLWPMNTMGLCVSCTPISNQPSRRVSNYTYFLRSPRFGQLFQEGLRVVQDCVRSLAVQLRVIPIDHGPAVREILPHEIAQPHSLAFASASPRAVRMSVQAGHRDDAASVSLYNHRSADGDAYSARTVPRVGYTCVSPWKSRSTLMLHRSSRISTS